MFRHASCELVLMGRLRKEEGAVDARSRIIETFWILLEDNRLYEISVGMLVAGAHCSRGTFYYHFSCIEDCAAAAVKSEFLRDQEVNSGVFNMFTGVGLEAIDDLPASQRWKRLLLLIRKGGLEIVQNIVAEQNVEMWRRIFCPGGGELTPETQGIAEHLACGGLSLVTYHYRMASHGVEVPIPMEFLSDVSQRALLQMCGIQGVPVEDARARLQELDLRSTVGSGGRAEASGGRTEASGGVS